MDVDVYLVYSAQSQQGHKLTRVSEGGGGGEREHGRAAEKSKIKSSFLTVTKLWTPRNPEQKIHASGRRKHVRDTVLQKASKCANL